MGKKQKSKAEKRFMRQRREIAVSAGNDASYPDWKQRAVEAFSFYMAAILQNLKDLKEFRSKNKADLCKLMYILGRLAWNIATDSDSLEEARERIREPGSFPLPTEMTEDFMAILDAMVTFRWTLYPDMDAYIDDVEFKEISSDGLPLDISVSRRI